MPNLYPAKPTSTKEMVKARIAEYNNAINESTVVAEQLESQKIRKQNAIYESIYKNREAQTARYRKFTAFTEQVRDMLLEHVLFTLCSKALAKTDAKRNTSVMESYDNSTAIHAMTYKFIHENGGSAPLMTSMRLKGNCYYTETIHSLIESTFKAIMEKVDKNDPDTFNIDSLVVEKFKNEIASEDTDIMSEDISDKITAAIGEFIEGNIKDKDAIVSALEKTKDKIEEIDPEKEAVREDYARLGKRFITEVRNKKHGLFNEMVTVLSKEAITNKSLRENYFSNGKVNVGKVVEKSTIIYGFLETVNSMRLINITPEYIKENVLYL